MAIVWYKELGEEAKVAVWKIEETEQELKSSLILKDQELAFVDMIRKGKRTLHWLASRVLLRKLLNLNETEYLDTRLDEHDKPFIFNKSYHFSLSHSAEYAAAIVSRDHLVGCDLEQIHEKIIRIEEKFLSKEEIAFTDHSQKVNHLYATWSAKEALYKLYGKRNVSFKDNIHLHPFEFHSPGEIRACIQKDYFFKNFLVHYEILDGYMLAYVKD